MSRVWGEFELEKIPRLLAVGLVGLLLLACSPEASRTRDGGPGADVGNHSRNSPEPSTAPTLVARP